MKKETHQNAGLIINHVMAYSIKCFLKMFFVFMFFGQIKTRTHFDFYNNIYSITFFTTLDKADTRLV